VKDIVTSCLNLLEDTCIDCMQFAAIMVVSFITFLHIPLVPFFIIVYTVLCFACFCLIL